MLEAWGEVAAGREAVAEVAKVAAKAKAVVVALPELATEKETVSAAAALCAALH